MSEPKEPNWEWLWGNEYHYVDCTPAQFNNFLLTRATPILVRGEARDLGYKKIGPGVIRVFKKPTNGKCQYCGHKLGGESAENGGKKL